MTPGRGFDWRDARIAALDSRAARMLSADNIDPLARPLLSADNNLFQQLVESGASMASHSASPISFIDSTQLDIHDYSLLPSPALPLARGATAPRAGLLGPALLTTGRWRLRGRPARRLFAERLKPQRVDLPDPDLASCCAGRIGHKDTLRAFASNLTHLGVWAMTRGRCRWPSEASS